MNQITTVVWLVTQSQTLWSGKSSGALKTLTVNNDFTIAQTVKNLPVMQENRIQSLGREDPLEMGMAIHSIILSCRIP